jgi:phosphoribosylanthranilate isomerase
MSREISVKACGMTRVEDAVAAAALGASHVGFVFAESPRRASVELAAACAAALPAAVGRIGVFVTAGGGANGPSARAGGGASELIAIADRARLTGFQLHGEASSTLAAQLRAARPGLALLGALDVDKALGSGQIGEFLRVFDVILFDAPRIPGRARAPLDLAVLERVLSDIAPNDFAPNDFAPAARKRFWIAGGLRAETVASAVARVAPGGVDVASGVESAPGIKNADAMRDFIRAARGIGHGHRSR